MYKKLILIMFVILSLTFTSCGNTAPKPENEDEQSSTVWTPRGEPEKALEEIYKDVDIKGVEDGDLDFVTEVLGIDEMDFFDYYIKKTDGKYGVADVYLIAPTEGKMENVIRAFTAFRDSRALEFKNYNIYNSLEITQDAHIFTRGDYAVMIMLEDAETAEEIIKKYIPAK